MRHTQTPVVFIAVHQIIVIQMEMIPLNVCVCVSVSTMNLNAVWASRITFAIIWNSASATVRNEIRLNENE